MTKTVNAAAALDELIFCPDRWFVIDADNQRVARVVVPSIEAGLGLVGEGSVATLVGRVREELLVVDVDVEAERGHAITEQLVAWCERRGLWRLVRPSGGAEGRAHVFILHEGHEDALRAHVATLRAAWRVAARAVDVRRHVRPLSAPHRRGGCPRPLGALATAATGLRARLGSFSPTSPTSTTASTRAAAESCSRGAEPLAPRPRRASGLPAEWAAYLGAGVCPQIAGEDQSRSAIEAIATGHLLRAGHTAASAWQAIRGAHPQAMTKARASRRRWVLWVWNRAVRQDAEWAAQASVGDAGSRGSGSDDQGVAGAVAAAGEALWQLQWAVSGRRRPALLLVGHTVLDRMARTGSLRVPVPERDLVLDTGISDRKVIRACLRLIAGAGAATAPVGVLHTDSYDPSRKETSSYEFEIPPAPQRVGGVRETPPPRFHTPVAGVWATLPRLAHSLWRSLTTHPGLPLEKLARRAGVPPHRGDPLSSSQVRTTRDALEQLASAGLACCDAQGRWSARATVSEVQAEQAARAYGELVERIAGERVEFRAARSTEWSVARATAMKAQIAREKAWWDRLPRTEQSQRRGEYTDRFANQSVQQQQQAKAAWATRRVSAGGDEAQRHDWWLDSLSMDEVVARATRRAAWFAALPGPLQQAYASSWRGHRERFGISRGTTLATSRLEHADSLPDTRSQRDQAFLNGQRVDDYQAALAIGV